MNNKYSVAICGCAKNCEEYIDDVFQNIYKINTIFDIKKVLISFDISTDKTLLKLINKKKENILDIDIIINKNQLSTDRVINICNARNKILDKLRSNLDIDYFIMMDFDEVCSKIINLESLKEGELILKKFNNESISLSFNNSRYYDFWALSLDQFCWSCWHTNKPKDVMKEMKCKLNDKFKKSTENYIQVDSAFNGFCIYYSKTFVNSIYSTTPLFSQEKLTELKTKYTLCTDNIIDCEHRFFHMKSTLDNKSKHYIMKCNLFPEYTGEHAAFLYDKPIKLHIGSNSLINICHYTPLEERKKHMIEQCKKYNLDNNIKFITEYDREFLPNNYDNIFDTTILKKCEISLLYKHFKCYENILTQKYSDYGIVMEDDVIFKTDFINKVNTILESCPPNFDIIYIGVFQFPIEFLQRTGKKSPLEGVKNKFGNFTFMKEIEVFPWTGNNKGTDFYIISKSCCDFILKYIKKIEISTHKIKQPIDHFLGTLLFDKNIYWYDEEITIHGSWGEGWNKNAVFQNSMFDERGH